MIRTGVITLTDAQAEVEPQDSVRIHLYGPRGGYIGSTLIDETEIRRTIAELTKRLPKEPS